MWVSLILCLYLDDTTLLGPTHTLSEVLAKSFLHFLVRTSLGRKGIYNFANCEITISRRCKLDLSDETQVPRK